MRWSFYSFNSFPAHRLSYSLIVEQQHLRQVVLHDALAGLVGVVSIMRQGTPKECVQAVTWATDTMAEPRNVLRCLLLVDTFCDPREMAVHPRLVHLTVARGFCEPVLLKVDIGDSYRRVACEGQRLKSSLRALRFRLAKQSSPVSSCSCLGF